MLCKKCNEEIYNNDKCPFCGQIQTLDIIDKTPIIKKNCDTCNHDYSSRNEECLKCPANPFKKTVDTPDDTNTINNIKCKSCNKETPENLRYCIHCGHNNKQNKKTISFAIILIPLIILMTCFATTIIIMDKNQKNEEIIIIEQQKQEEKLQPRNYESIKFEDGKDFIDTVISILIEIEEVNQLKKEIIFEYFKEPNLELFQQKILIVEEKSNNIINKVQLLKTNNHKALQETKMILLVNHVSPCIEKTIHFSAGVLLNDNKYLQDSTLTENQNDFSTINAYITLLAQKSGFTKEALDQKITELTMAIENIQNN